MVELDAEGNELARYDSSIPGIEHGPVAKARFRDPQGPDTTDEMILLADTGNHAIRVIDRRVSTRVGRGIRGPVLDFEPKPAQAVTLAGGFLCEDAICIPAAEPAYSR